MNQKYTIAWEEIKDMQAKFMSKLNSFCAFKIEWGEEQYDCMFYFHLVDLVFMLSIQMVKNV